MGIRALETHRAWHRPEVTVCLQHLLRAAGLSGEWGWGQGVRGPQWNQRALGWKNTAATQRVSRSPHVLLIPPSIPVSLNLLLTSLFNIVIIQNAYRKETSSKPIIESMRFWLL